MSAELFTQIVNIALIVIFILILLGFIFAAIHGYRKGLWSSAFRMLFMFVFIGTGLMSLSAIADFIANINLDSFIPVETIVITNTSSGVTYYAPITSLHDTLVSAFRGYYYVFNTQGNYLMATEFAEALAVSAIKLVTFIVIMIVTGLLGWLFSTILWHAAFKHLVPKLVRKKRKIGWAGAITSAVTYVVVTFLMMSPLTSMMNIINQNYDERNDQNEIVSYLNGFVSAYDNSLFAKTFFNWTVDSDSGMTLDANILSTLTSSSLENGSISIIGSINELANIASTLAENLMLGSNGQITFNVPEMISQEYIEALFASLKGSSLIMTILPIAVQLAVSADFLAGVVDPSLIDLSDAEWDKELDAIETIVIDIANSGLVDSFITEEGEFITPSNIETVIGGLMTSDAYTYTYHALRTISDSKLLSRALPAVVQLLINTNSDVQTYLPLSFETLNDIDWGFELSTIYDCLYQMYTIDDRILPAIMGLTSGDSESDDGEDPVELMDVIVENITAYSRIIVGETNSSNQLINIDSEGRTIVYQNGKKIPGRSYSLLDISLCKYLFSALPQALGSLLTEEGMAEAISTVMDELSTGVWRLNFKQEFNALFYILAAFADNPSAINTLISGQIIPEGGSIGDIDPELIKVINKAIKRIDNSRIIYVILVPMIRDLLTSGEISDAFAQTGIDIAIVQDGIDKAEASKTLGTELSKILSAIKHIGVLVDILSAEPALDVPTLIEELGNANESIAHALDAIYSCRLINPIPEDDDSYELNENYINAMSYIFGDSLGVDGLVFDETLLGDPNIRWVNSTNSNGEYFHDRYGRPIYDGENGAIANVIRALGSSGLMEVILDEHFFDEADLTDNLASLETEYHLSSLLKTMAKSKVFSSTLGHFLDAQLQETGILDLDIGVSFTNVQDWDTEADNLGNLLIAIGEASINIADLDLTSAKNVVGLNNLLHALADSSIFVDKTSGDYLFSPWLYSKVKDSLSGFSDDSTTYDLIKDPVEWDNAWGAKGDDDYTIVARDFASLMNKEDWVDEDFDSDDFDVSIYESPLNLYANYWDNPQFILDYASVFQQDEIGRICQIIYWATQALEEDDLFEMPSSVFSGFLDSINQTVALRVAVFNLFEIAKTSLDEGGSTPVFDLSPANTTYLISCDQAIDDYETSRTLRQFEINHLVSVYSAYRTLSDKEVLDTVNGLVLENFDEEVSDSLRDAVIEIQESNVFHRKGSINDPDLDNDNDGFYPTVLQNLIKSLLSNEAMSSIVYNSDNPKDIYYYSTYEDYLPDGIVTITDNDVMKAKVDFTVDRYFDYAGVHEFDYADQIAEINKIFDVVDSIISGPNPLSQMDFNALDIESFDTDGVRTALLALNETQTLYDSVPNLIYKIMNGDFTAFEGVNLADATIFYHYDASGTTNYETKYDEDEIFNIIHLLDDYQDFTDVVGLGNIQDLSVMKNLLDSGIIENVLTHTYRSHILHTSNQYLTNPNHMTIFEQVINMIVTKSGFSDYTYATDPDTQMRARIKAVTAYDEAAKDDPLVLNPNGYHEFWLNPDLSGNDEIHALINFMKGGQELLGEVGTMDVANLQMSNFSPIDIRDLIYDLNRVDFLSDAVPIFVSHGFDTIGLNNLATYGGTRYTYYDIGQLQYGGARDGSDFATSEINLIYLALNNLAQYDIESNFVAYDNFQNLANFSTLVGTAYFDGIMTFVTDSHIFNTDPSGNYDTMWYIAPALPASARGLLLYNALTAGQSDPVHGTNFGDYITGATPEEKIATLSKLYTFDNFDKIAESRGLYTLAANSLNIDTNNLTISDFSSITDSRDAINESTRVSYDAYSDGTNVRSYIASELVSGLLDDVMEEQYPIIDGYGYYYEIIQFGPVDYVGVNQNAYDNVNQNECDGVEGSLEIVIILDGISHGDTPTRAQLEGAFTLMDNSASANIFYLARIHNKLGLLASGWSDYTSDVYAPGFLYSIYGNSLADYYALP